MSQTLTVKEREWLEAAGFDWAVTIIDELEAKLAAKEKLAERVAQINAGLLREARKGR